MNNDLISRKALIQDLQSAKYLCYDNNSISRIGNHEIDRCISFVEDAPTVEERTGEWNNHKVACLLAELFGDACACNYCGIDEWLPQKCDFANKECPNVVGVACWEQFLKHRSKMKGEEE